MSPGDGGCRWSVLFYPVSASAVVAGDALRSVREQLLHIIEPISGAVFDCEL